MASLRERSSEQKLLHRGAHDSAECLHVCAAGQAPPRPYPRARFRQRTPPTPPRCGRHCGSRYHSAASLPTAWQPERAEGNSRRGSHRARERMNSDCRAPLVLCASASGERRRRLACNLSNPSGIATVSRTTKSLHQHGRCRSHLTRHKISCREPSGHATQHTLTTADTTSVDDTLARGQLHRLVRWFRCHPRYP